MNFKVIGDLHLVGIDLIDLPVIDWLRSVIKSEDNIIFLGDIFDSFEIGIQNTIFYDFIGSLDNEIYIIQGNHDFKQGLNSMSMIPFFSKNIHIIKDYEYYDVHQFYRFHFQGFFRYKSETVFDLGEKKLNFLFSHCEVNNMAEIPEPFKVMDQVFNGHIHDSGDYFLGGKKEFHNVGSSRQVKNNENTTKRYFEINIDEQGKVSFKIERFITPTLAYKTTMEDFNIESAFASHLFNDLESNIVLTVQISSVSDREQLVKYVDDYNSTNKYKIILKTEMIGKAKNDIAIKIDQVQADSHLDFGTVFDSYYKEFQKEYKIEEDSIILKNLFLENASGLATNSLDLHSIKFKSIGGANFKLFPTFYFDLSGGGITSIIGQNFDEPQEDGSPSSNESGKSNLIMAFLYGLQGSASDISPLRWGEKEGWVTINMVIDGDDILITRHFQLKKNELVIEVNGVPFSENETNTNVQEMFFEKYNIESVIQFIFLTNSGFAKYFFSSKSSERYNLFQSIFPVIGKVDQILENVKQKVGTLKVSLDASETLLNSVKMNRLDVAKRYDASKRSLMEQRVSIGRKITMSQIVLDDLTRQFVACDVVGGNIEESTKIEHIFGAVKEDFYTAYVSGLNIDQVETYMSLDAVVSNQKKSFDKTAIELKIKNLEEVESKKYRNDLDGLNEQLKVFNENLLDASSFSELEKKRDSELVKHNTYTAKSIELTKEITGYNSRIEELGKLLEKNEKDGLCPFCGSPLKDDKLIEGLNTEKNGLVALRVDKTSELVKTKTLISEIVITISDLDTDLKKNINIKQSMSSLELKKQNLEDRLLSCQKSIGDLKDQLVLAEQEEEDLKQKKTELEVLRKGSLSGLLAIQNGLRGYISIFDSLSAYNDKIGKFSSLGEFISDNRKKLSVLKAKEDLANRMKNIDNEIESTRNSLIENGHQLDLLAAQVSDENKLTRKKMKSIQDDIDRAREKYRLHDVLYKVLAGKKSMTFAKYFVGMFFEKLSGIFNSFLEFLFSRDVRIQLEGVDFSFFDGKNEKISFKDFSLGAKTKIEFALLLTINMIFRNFGVDSDLIFFDEFLDTGLDAVNQERVFRLIQHFYVGKKVLVVSHKGAGEYSDQILTIRREGGSSQIIY